MPFAHGCGRKLTQADFALNFAQFFLYLMHSSESQAGDRETVSTSIDMKFPSAVTPASNTIMGKFLQFQAQRRQNVESIVEAANKEWIETQHERN